MSGKVRVVGKSLVAGKELELPSQSLGETSLHLAQGRTFKENGPAL